MSQIPTIHETIGPEPQLAPHPKPSKDSILQYINENVIGHLLPLTTPFGTRPLVYADYTASGRCLRFIEDYISRTVFPYYGNTHTSTSWVSLQCSFFREEARSIIHRCVGASEEDCVLFTGSGSTSAVNRLVSILKLSNWSQKRSYYKKNRWGSVDCTLCKMSLATQGHYLNHLNSAVHLKRQETDPEERSVTPVVFLSIYEHHSNLLPWREAGAVVETIGEDTVGQLDINELERKLALHRDAPVKIGSFSAASNVTGILVDTEKVASVLRSYGALVFFDFAACAPYVSINMNQSQESAYDAIFISVHKFIGGPSSPGLLVMKKALLGNTIPAVPGGGTVFFVTEEDHNYLINPEEREEGGTPDIVGAIRAGLVFQLKEAVGEDLISRLEKDFAVEAQQRLSRNPHIALAGDTVAPRMPIFSFLVKCGARFFHYSYISALFNDLFGIEVRGGCACAGPYALTLMGISGAMASEIRNTIEKGYDLFRPGMVRLNINYFYDAEVVRYLLDAVDFIAENALWFLPQYKFDMDRSAFVHRKFTTKQGRHHIRKWLGDVSYQLGRMKYPQTDNTQIRDFNMYLEEARLLVQGIKDKRYDGLNLPEHSLETPSEFDHLRWFVLPSEVLAFLQGRTNDLHTAPGPFTFKLYSRAPVSPELPELPARKQSKFQKKAHPLSPLIPKKLLKKGISAISDFSMIHDGDRVLVCLSGGKDSLTLLHILRQVQKTSPKKFQLAAATVDPQVPEYDPSPLKPYLAALEIPYFYESFPIVQLAAEKMTKKLSLCAFCSRMKRGILYSCARREGYNVLALGQHLDDIAESFVMSLFHNGLLRTMKGSYVNNAGDLRIIRPLVYVRERETREMAEAAGLPVISENCPACFAEPTERHRTKLLLATQEQLIPDLFSSIRRAINPLMKDNLGDLLGAKRVRDEEGEGEEGEEGEEDCKECLFSASS